MGIYIEGLEMPKKDIEMLRIDIYPDGKVSSRLDLRCGQIATAVETSKAPGWISVKDELPERLTPVIVCRRSKQKEDPIVVESGTLDLNGWWKVYGSRTKSVTHWMPLPEPPEGEMK